MKRRSFLVLSSTLVAGCSAPPETGAVLSVSVDASRSFLDKAEPAYRHFNACRTAFSRAFPATTSRIVVSQISGATDGIQFDGSTMAFARQFPTAESFKTWLAERTNADYSRVCLSLLETVEWLCNLHRKNHGMTSSLIVYSDMVDTHGGQEKLMAALKEYSQYQVSMWFYWVEDHKAWEAALSGINIRFQIEPKFVAEPPVPQF